MTNDYLLPLFRATSASKASCAAFIFASASEMAFGFCFSSSCFCFSSSACRFACSAARFAAPSCAAFLRGLVARRLARPGLRVALGLLLGCLLLTLRLFSLLPVRFGPALLVGFLLLLLR